ncbi:hypothetical protein F441_12345 [Phytophthora nicotianae CJ01A1]|uniref:Uncharacterized protein n=5 Tax=Phytophthora nicotianae TaxID=4792 RepID=V9EUK4_PHYNI|nr:hypothetical protein F443_12360 [Phytophthora nicotianae P1569]ETL35956.1 hypothetical protein L916_12005 [Phytophthora nicotianae]ETP12262.1 hypothetical protein F441_12345 [Phytophthora nicotianae CJ01A1]ETP40391.1 hypothetical protein F442_12277 [Phytophthora nicotianae P10297]ETL89188.1 hypothetical protein L917_11848 [Phytophthora nicotianae]
MTPVIEMSGCQLHKFALSSHPVEGKRMKVPKMMIDYTLRFGIPIALCYAYWDPKSDEDIRRDVESKIKPDLETRKKKQAKFAELLLQKDGISSESKQQLDRVTAFTKTKEQYLADKKKEK